MMLDASDPNFSDRYPYGAIVRDRWGRRILGVMACNPETGEVISCNGTWLTGQWLRLTRRFRVVVVTRHALRWVSPSGGLLRCHGFWPAPLTIEEREPAGSETTAAIKLIFAAITEHNAAIQHSLASLGASAQDATWSARQLQTAPDPNPETAAKIERIRFAAAIRRLSAVLRAGATHSPRE